MASLQYLIVFTIYYCLLSRINCDDVTEIIKESGYPCKLHTVTTKDGYILGIHRIPFSKFSNHSKGNKEPVLLMHGILSSSADWVVLGRQISLAFQLSDAGFDVWLGNVRGNTYSKKHILLSSESNEFWDFSLDEFGQIDVPTTIDYILNKTKHSSLFYVGYSQGTTILMITLSALPEYNSKIKTAILLAPIVYMKNFPNQLFHGFLFDSAVQIFSKLFDYYEIFPKAEMNSLTERCNGGGFINIICEQAISSIAGPIKNMNLTFLPKILKTFPAGASTKQFIHYSQMISSGKFQSFDYEKGNFERYGQETPIAYSLGDVEAPIAIFYGTNDNVLAETDALEVVNDLKMVVGVFKVDGFNHFDFLYSPNTYEAINSHVIEIFERQ